MADSSIRVPPDSTGSRVDCASLDVSTVAVMRQRIVIGDNSAVAEFAVVSAGSLQVSFPSPPTIQAISAAVTVTGGVAISGTAQVAIGTPFTVNNISATVTVAGVVGLTAGTAVIGDLNAISRTVQVAVGTPFTVNNISASVVVATGATADFNTLASADQVQTLPIFGIALPAAGGAVAWDSRVTLSGTGSVILAAGAANIGIVNNISATVNVVVGAGTSNIGFINNISATVTVAGVVGLTAGTAVIGDINAISRTVQVAIATPFTVNNISATVVVAGAVTISLTPSVVLAAGVANIGIVNNISATVVDACVRKYASLTVNTASHGPRMVLASTSANAVLVAAPGVGLAIYVTMVGASNASGTNARGRFGTSATVGALQMMMAASGGGFVMQLDPPWKLSTNEALVCSVKPNVSEGMFNCNFFVASADAY